ncbi:MAG: ACT domain-containing protein [Vicinamibacterales bacterium]
MIVVDIPRRFRWSTLDIPAYHRVPIAAVPDTKLHLCFLPRSVEPSFAGTRKVPELIISPIPFDKWSNIWRITTTLRDRPGLLNDITEVLNEHDIDIESVETTSTEEQAGFQFEFLVYVGDDRSVLPAALGESPLPISLRNARWHLLGELIDDIHDPSDGRQPISIRRVKTLAHARAIYQSEKRSADGTNAVSPSVVEAGFEIRERDRSRQSNPPDQPHHALRLRIPRAIASSLRRSIESLDIGSSDSTANHAYSLRISDTKDRYLRVLFFHANEPVIHARIEHANRTGALANITRALREGGFDLVTTMSRLSLSQDSRASLEIVARSVDVTGVGVEAIKAHLLHALQIPECDDLDLRVGYPRDYGTPATMVPVLTEQTSTPRQNPNSESKTHWRTRISSRLDTKFELLQQKSVSGFLRDGREQLQWALVNQLRSEQLDWTRPRPRTLFVSGHFANQAAFDAVRTIAEEEFDFRVITGENVADSRGFSAGLVDRIKLCSHFLGVWSHTGSLGLGESSWPSPWLHWELGVARACGLNWRLLISDKIDQRSWDRIKADVLHSVYSESQFTERLRAVLIRLAQDPPTKEWLASLTIAGSAGLLSD